MFKHFKKNLYTGIVNKQPFLFNYKTTYRVRLYYKNNLIFDNEYQIAKSYEEAFNKTLEEWSYTE